MTERIAENARPGSLSDPMAAARAGQLSVRLEPEEFARIDHECNSFQEVIREIQREMTAISRIEAWGIGDHPGSRLTSAPMMAKRFRDKAQGGADAFFDVLEAHFTMVEDIRWLHQEVRDRFMAHDEHWAARYRTELTSLSQEPLK